MLRESVTKPEYLVSQISDTNVRDPRENHTGTSFHQRRMRTQLLFKDKYIYSYKNVLLSTRVILLGLICCQISSGVS